MEAITRPTIALTAATAVAFGSALGAGPSALMASHSVFPATSAVVAQDVMLTGFIANIYDDIESVVSPIVYSVSDLIGAVPLVGPPIANQIDILYGYGQAAVADTVYWVDDLVTPLVNGNFWPLSGAPGNYLAGAVNSTIDWGQALVNTAVGFVGAEIDYFFGWIPNIPSIPSIINNVINTIKNIIGWFNIPNIINNVVNAVQNVINWIIGWIPGPFAAVATPAAAAAIATAPRSVARRAAAAPASATKAAPVGKREAKESSSPKGTSTAGDPDANVAGDDETEASAAKEDRRSARADRAAASTDGSKRSAKQSRSHSRSAGAAKSAARSAE